MSFDKMNTVAKESIQGFSSVDLKVETRKAITTLTARHTRTDTLDHIPELQAVEDLTENSQEGEVLGPLTKVLKVIEKNTPAYYSIEECVKIEEIRQEKESISELISYLDLINEEIDNIGGENAENLDIYNKARISYYKAVSELRQKLSIFELTVEGVRNLN